MLNLIFYPHHSMVALNNNHTPSADTAENRPLDFTSPEVQKAWLQTKLAIANERGIESHRFDLQIQMHDALEGQVQ